jgi:ABC-type glycerol-3-phosphate transport system substrate-binding protein
MNGRGIMDIKKVAGKIGEIAGKLRRFLASTDTILWIWVVLMAAALLLFNIFGKSLPRLGTNLVFVQWWEEDVEPEILQNLISEYEELNPGIRIKLEYKSRGEVRALLDEYVPGDDKDPKGADVFTLEPNWIDGLSRDGILAQTAEGGAGEPLISFINPLFYNIQLLQASGFDRPPKNREELLAYAEAISKNGVYGAALALAGEDPQSVNRHLLSWIWTSGINIEGEDQNFKFNTRPIIETLNFLNQLKSNLYPGPFFLSEEERQRIFSEGKTGMMIGSVSEIKELRAKMGDAFGITTVPGPQSYVGKPFFVLSGWYLGLNERGEKKEEAGKFADFLREKSDTLAAAAFAVPGSGKRDTELIKSDFFYAKAGDMSDAGGMVREHGGLSPELNNIIREEVKRMFDGSQNPEKTADAIQDRWEKLYTP